MSCGTNNPNPLDACGRAQFQCNNPCNHSPGCDLLPTQIDTFSTQFFGNDLGKTNLNGQVSWILPCGLGVGTSANPRLPGESLACYFLRLLESGIVGHIGAQGPAGLAGPCGQDAFTVTAQGFVQPDLSDPYVTVSVRPGFSLVEGLPVEIQNSGYYVVEDVEESQGAVLLRLTAPFIGAPAVIPIGSIVIASGLPGPVITGPQGQQGTPGIRGPAGSQGITTVGPTGPQGAKVPTVFGQSSQPHTAILTSSYTHLAGGNDFALLPSNAHTYFVVFVIGISVFNTFNVALAGELTVQLQVFIDGVFSSVAVGTTHGFNALSNASSSIGYIIRVPYIFSGVLGHTMELRPFAKSTMNGSSTSSATVGALHSLQLTPYP